MDGTSSNKGADEGGDDGRSGGDGGGVAAGSAMVVAATDAGVLHLSVGEEGAVVAFAAAAVTASTLAAGAQVQASPKRRCSRRVDSV